jgi:alkylation response protein AidB-like acyl-CoA dehydrogenase
VSDLIERTRALTPIVERAAERTEELGTMPDDLVDAIAEAGLFWLLVPQELGGSEVDVRTALDVFEELAYADGSTGWSVMANNTSTCFAAIYTGDAAVDAMFGAARRDGRRPPIHAGMFGPVGTITLREGGIVLDGSYSFGSGCGHADWIAAGGMVTVDGRPAVDELGLPDMRVAFLPRDEVELTGNWDVLGLAGTGSYDYRVDARAVGEPFTFSLLTCSPQRGGDIFRLGLFALTAMGHAGFALGIGRRALDEVVRIARTKQRLGGEPIADQQLFQHDFAMQDAAMRGARAAVHEAFEAAEAALDRGGSPTNLQQQRMRQATTYATRVAADSARFAYTWAGSTGLRQPSVVGRCFRDISAGTQHLFVDNNTLTAYTQALLAES